MNIRFRPIFKDVFLTFVTQAIVLVTFFFIYRLIAKNFGPYGVGQYSLVRRAIGILQPLLLLGLGVGLPRYIAMSQNREQRSNYIKSGYLLVGIFTFIVLLFINLFKTFFAKLFFGSVDCSNLVLPLSFLSGGLVLHVLVYSYFRGRLFAKIFNLLQIVNTALVPVIILVFLEKTSIVGLVTSIGIATFVISFVFLLFFIEEFFVYIRRQTFKDSLKELLRYGVPRVPGDFIFAGFFSMGVILAVHFASVEEAGYLSVSQSLLTTIGVVTSPLYLILVPKVSKLIVQERTEEITESLNYLIWSILQCTVFVCIQSMIFADIIIRYWLGPEFSVATPVMRIVFFSMIFYLLYSVEGAVLEAAKVKPLNVINVSISFALFLIVSGILLFCLKLFSVIISLSISFTAGIVCLGVLTHISIRKIYKAKIRQDLKCFFISVSFSILLGAIAISSKSFLTSNLCYLIIFEALMVTVYLVILSLLQRDWIKPICKMIYQVN